MCLEAADHLLCAVIEPDAAEPIIRPAVRILTQDPDRDARIAAARLLRHFRHREALGALIEALNQPEFAVTYVAEQALVELTGQTHHRDYSDWMAWRNGTDDPFARRGDRSRDPGKPWWNIFTR